MSQNIWIAFGITLAAGLATVLGGAWIFFSKQPKPRTLAFGLAFSGGAMVYVSLTEIMNKSISSFSDGYNTQWAAVFATFAFLMGLIGSMLLDRLVPNPHESLDVNDPRFKHINQKYIQRIGIMAATAITLHNLPEGLATFFATLENPALGLPLALAIAIHNIPEGIAIAAPVYFATQDKRKTLILCLVSGLAEPFGAILGYVILQPFLSDAMFGIVFGIIAGVMVFLALDELLPAAKRYAQGHETVYGLTTGMVVMSISLVLFNF